MTDPAIHTVDREILRGIIERGTPAGLWMAKGSEFPTIWTGVDSRPGHLCLMKHGTFPEVLDWLMLRGGIMRHGEKVQNRNPLRERKMRGARSSVIPVRIEGAEIKEWKTGSAPVRGHDGTYAAQYFASGAGPVGEARQPGKAGNRTPDAMAERDEKILKLAADGLMWVEIAKRIGVTPKVISQRINYMRQRGQHIPNKALMEARAKRAVMDDRIVSLVNAGLRLSAIARELGEQKRAVARRMAKLREEGRIG